MSHICKTLIISSVFLTTAIIAFGFDVQQVKALWFDSSWTYRQEWVVQIGEVSTSSAQFIAAATTTQDVLRFTGHAGNVASSTAGDIVFTDWDDNKIDHEIEKYASSTGELVVHVKIPFVSSTSTRSIFMYYGNASATYQPTNAAVWSTGYTGVWHLSEDPAVAGTGGIRDSSENAALNDLTDEGTMDANDQVQGTIDGSLDFDGTDDVLALDDEAQEATDNWTISAWFTHDAAGQTRWIFANGVSGSSGGNGYGIQIVFVTPNYFVQADLHFVANSRCTTTLTAGVWYYATVKRESGTTKCFTNGVQSGTTTGSNPNTPSLRTAIGARDHDTEGPSRFHNGIIDDVRISNIAKDDDWIRTEYNNQQAVNEFFTFGAEETETPAAPAGIFQDIIWFD